MAVKPAVTIRQLNPSDAEAYYRLRLEALTRFPQAFGTSADEFRLQGLSTLLERLRPTPDSYTFGAWLNAELVGMVTLIRNTMHKTRHKADIFSVYVQPECQGQGVGRALMLTAIEQAKHLEGLEQLMLVVAVSQTAAQKLYDSLGFEVWGYEKNALKVDGEYIDEEYRVLWLGRL